MTTPIIDPAAPHTVEGLLRVVEERDAEVVLLKLMVDKLKLQLLRSRRARFGSSSEQLDDPQIALLDEEPLYEVPAPIVPAAPDAANAPQIDRKLPAHLPRESQVYPPETSTAHHDADGRPCGCTACGGRLHLIGRDVSEPRWPGQTAPPVARSNCSRQDGRNYAVAGVSARRAAASFSR